MSKRLTIALATLLLAAARVTADWPQFLGPDRNGVYRGTPIATTFPDSSASSAGSCSVAFSPTAAS